MPESIYEGPLFKITAGGGDGIQIDRSLRLLSVLLSGWCAHNGDRDLSSIPFDKFGGLSYRLWNALFEAKGKHSPTPADGNATISFRVPFDAIPGKHGPGPGRIDPVTGNDPTFLLDIIFSLQNDGTANYFEITPPSTDPDNHKHPKACIRPGMPPEGLLSKFNATEQYYANRLRDAFKHLTKDEIRALGTHSTQEMMVKHVEKEFRDLSRKDLIRSTLTAIDSGGSFLEDARQIAEYMEEARRKSETNKLAYAKGFEKLSKEFLTEPLLLNIFTNCQSDPGTIWDGSSMISNLADKARKSYFFSRYLHALAYYRDNPSGRPPKSGGLARRFGRDWNEGWEGMGESGLQGFPHNVHDVFLEHTGVIKTIYRDKIANELKSFLL